MRVRTIAVTLILLVAFGAVGWARRQAEPPRPHPVEKGDQLVVTTTAKKQDLLITVSQTGVVVAKNSTPVIPEISGRIQSVCGNGIVVSAGEVVVRLDPTKFQEQLTDLTVRYDEAVRRQAQAGAVGKARMKEMRLRLQRARDDVAAFERQQEVTLRQLSDAIAFHAQEIERRREELEVKKRLAAKGIVAGTEVEREQATLKAMEFSLQRERSDYELKKFQAASDALDRRRNVNNTTRDMMRTRNWSERDVRMTGNQVDNLKLQVERAQEDLARTTLTAPVGGLVVLSPQGGWRGESRLPRLGDWVSQGREVAQIVSLGRMQVKLELDQTQITGARMAQAAEVAIEALPGKALTGRITAIGQTARRPPIQGWMGLSSTATFPVTIDLPPTGKSLIRPGMRASVRIVARRIKGAISVPTGCIFRHDGHPVVFVERNGRFTRAAVELGESNGDYTAVTKGLNEGDRIALNDLSASPSSQTPTKEQRK
jgi:RND family efflux transporter MFP subunit